jgi:hypothetical protein
MFWRKLLPNSASNIKGTDYSESLISQKEDLSNFLLFFVVTWALKFLDSYIHTVQQFYFSNTGRKTTFPHSTATLEFNVHKILRDCLHIHQYTTN